MVGPVVPRPTRQPLYKRTAMASLRLAAVAALSFGVGGCAMSGHFGGLLGGGGGEGARAYASEDTTGSVGGVRQGAAAAESAAVSETDLVFARMAVVDVLRRGSKEISAPWENPSSGARGTVTPLASAYVRDGRTCRDFLASYVRRKGPETWFQGEACREAKGAWAVKSLRPWTRS